MWQGLGSAIIGGLGNLFGVSQQNKNIDKQLREQRRENEKNREYNLMLATKQNAWNLEQWNRENEYNSPSAQKARLEAAGLNADMMYGGSGVSNTAAPSPSMTSGAPSSPMDWSSLANKQTISDVTSSFLDNQYKQALIDNVNADTQKKGHEGSILASDAAFRDAWNAGLLETQHVDIRLKGSSAELNDQNIKESQARVRSLDATTANVSTATQKILNDIKNDNARLELEKVFNAANVEKLAASCDLDKANAKSISQQLEKILRQYDDKHSLDGQQFINLGHEGRILFSESGAVEFEAKVRSREGYDKNLTLWQNSMMFVDQIMSSVGHLIHK